MRLIDFIDEAKKIQWRFKADTGMVGCESESYIRHANNTACLLVGVAEHLGYDLGHNSNLFVEAADYLNLPVRVRDLIMDVADNDVHDLRHMSSVMKRYNINTAIALRKYLECELPGLQGGE